MNADNCKEERTECALLLSGERFDDLQEGGLKIIQNPDLYCFTSDAVLLADFARVRYNETVADLGTGSGIIAFLLAARTKAKIIYGVEIQSGLYDMARRSAVANGLEKRVNIIHGDMRNAHTLIGQEACDVVTVNPPYRREGSGDKSAKNESTRRARHETDIDLRGVIKAAARLLKYGGRLYMIHQSQRIDDIFKYADENNIAVKTMQLIQPTPEKAPHLVLIEGQKGGKAGVRVLPNKVISYE
jgi:tRNA1Val (adenine37-N6)-methyltransferase